jgi:hypothetical protein
MTQRDGRIIRYLLADHPVRAILTQQQAGPEPHPVALPAAPGA